MVTIVTRAGKGAELTYDEMDANFTNLDTEKPNAANPTTSGTMTHSGPVVLAPAGSPITNVASINGGQLAGFRNRIINGSFDIWQRGTSFAQTSGAYTADRWTTTYAGSGLIVTCSRQSFALGEANAPNMPLQRYFYRQVVIAAGALSANVLEQKIESVTTLAGQTATLSFAMKASSPFTLDTTYGAFIQNFGTGGSPSAQVNTAFNTGIINDTAVTTNWKRFTITVNLPSISGKTLGTNGDDALRAYFWLPVTNGLSVDITNIQLEEGSIATPFEQRPYGLELSLCQRYYESGYAAAGTRGGDAIAIMLASFKVSKRASPTMTYSVANGGDITTDNTFVESCEFRNSPGTASTGRATWFASAEL